jgi:hypothetical protein
MAMKIDRTDIVGKIIYMMTEKHRYKEVLPLLKEIEPRTSPIKDVTLEKRGIIATGYKVPISTGLMERIIRVLEDAEPKL